MLTISVVLFTLKFCAGTNLKFCLSAIYTNVSTILVKNLLFGISFAVNNLKRCVTWHAGKYLFSICWRLPLFDVVPSARDDISRTKEGLKRKTSYCRCKVKTGKSSQPLNHLRPMVLFAFQNKSFNR